jgi:predicted secreted hydrolase
MTLDHRRIALSIMILVLLSATACITSAKPREIPTNAKPNPTATPAPVLFPGDELAHDSRLEWWYHSGHLVSESGREFGFHFVVFKAADDFGEPNFVAQLGLLDVATGEHFDLSRAEVGIRTPDTNSAKMAMSLGISGWDYGISITPGSQNFNAKTENVSLSLQFEAITPVMLHNEIGWIPTEAGATYYYSWPRQQAIGELTLNGETLSVTGSAWFDHQWGDFFVLGKPAGWQWFAIQLDDGGSLMITEARGIDGEIAETYGTYMSPDGEVKTLHGEVDGIDIRATGEWTSPTTDATYPSGWAIEIESLAIDLLLSPVAENQEVQGGLPASSTYWEGKVTAEGTQDGSPISADAYVELSGYVDPEPVEWVHR